MASSARLYVYEGQSASVRALLDAAGLGAGFQGIMAVSQPEHLFGLGGGTFAIVKNHPRRLPQAFMEMIVANGMRLIELSDEFARAKAKERMRASAAIGSATVEQGTISLG